MVFYIVVLCLLALLAFLNDEKEMSFHHKSEVDIKRKSYIFLVGILAIYVLMILKKPLYGDYAAYAAHFMNILYKTLRGEIFLLSEPGYFALNTVIRKLTDNTFYFFAITSAIICISISHYISKFAINKKYAVYFYYTIGLFAFSMAGLRQTIAMSICLFSYSAMKERKLLKFSLFIAIAFLFHKSAIFFFPAYFIAGVKWKFKNICCSLILYGFLCLFFRPIYSYIAKVLHYNYGIENTGNGGIFLIILSIIAILAVIYRKQLLLMDPSSVMFVNLHFTVVALWFFRLVTRTVERPAYYYLYASIILLDRILSINPKLDKDVQTKKILIICSLFFFGLFFLYRLARDRNLLPYVLIS